MENQPTPLPTTPSPDLSTPHCPAEHRAWLLIYQMRIGWGKPLVKAFSAQFPHCETHHTLYHARRLRHCDGAVLAQLVELAKRCEWYEEPPQQEGERYYKRTKKLERQEAARGRLLSKGFAWGDGGVEDEI